MGCRKYSQVSRSGRVKALSAPPQVVHAQPAYVPPAYKPIRYTHSPPVHMNPAMEPVATRMLDDYEARSIIDTCGRDQDRRPPVTYRRMSGAERRATRRASHREEEQVEIAMGRDEERLKVELNQLAK